MAEDKSIQTIDELDRKIQEQKQRLGDRIDPPQEQPIPDHMRHLPWTKKMEEAFKENIVKGQKCLACNWMNTGQMLAMMNYIEVMRENLPIPTLICRHCGTLFVPKWARKVINQAFEQQNKILKRGTAQQDGV